LNSVFTPEAIALRNSVIYVVYKLETLDCTFKVSV